MIARPGTFLGFVAHDLRLGARGFLAFLGERSPRAKALIMFGVFAALHAVAWPFAMWLGAREIGPDGASFITAEMRAGAMFVLPWVIASPMTSVTRMLFQRGDIDLILASPTRPRGWLAARLVALAIEGVGSVGMLALPIANVSAMQGRPHWLALYPTLAAAGLFGAGIGLMIALGLFFAFGPRRARVVSQIVATLIGASAVLAAQIVAMLSEGARARLYEALGSSSSGGDALRAVLTLPERAASGDVAALIGWIGLALAIFAVAILVCG